MHIQRYQVLFCREQLVLMGFSCRSCHGSSWPSHQFWPWYSWWVALRRVAASVCQCFLLSCLAPLTGFYITQVVGDGGISDHQENSEALSSVKSIMTWPKGFQVVSWVSNTNHARTTTLIFMGRWSYSQHSSFWWMVQCNSRSTFPTMTQVVCW